MNKRLLPALFAFALTAFATLPGLARPMNGDESQYAWTAAYYGGRLLRWDWSPPGADTRLDPGWGLSEWSLTQPMGTRWLYAAVMAATGTQPSAEPFDWEYWWRTRGAPQPNTDMPARTLLLLRLVSILCAATGFALFAVRWRWWALLATALILLPPNVRGDLAWARAEGQLILAFGLVAVAYGTRWLPVVLGLALSIKLTALGLWPLLLLPGACGRWRYAWLTAPFVALAVWTLTEPPAWLYGPDLLWQMLAYRGDAWAVQTANSLDSKLLGVYFPSRYALPAVVGAWLLLCCGFLPRWFAERRAKHVSSPPPTPS